MNDDINYTKEAFLNTWNLVFLLVVTAVAVGTALTGLAPGWLVELVLALGAGGEFVYLGIMPRHERFRRHVRSQKRAERHKAPSQRETFSQLRNRSQRRYAKLRKLKDQIQSNYHQLSYASQGILNGHLQKIDGLLASYLELLHKRERYRSFRESATASEIRQSIVSIKDDMADDSDRVRSVKQRRLSVLEQRLARIHKAQENLEIIGAQLGTIEDVVKYIYEQSWTLQNPKEVTMQLDALLEEVEATQGSIREIEDVFGASGDDLDEDLEALDDELAASLDSSETVEGSLGRSDDERGGKASTEAQASRVRE
jgi:hypothetical protein